MAGTSTAKTTQRGPSRRTFIAGGGLLMVAIVAVVLAFRPGDSSPSTPAAGAPTPGPAPARLGFTVVNTYPHDPEAFTQGLIYRDGFLYESAGRYGYSSLRQVRLETGEVVRQVPVDAKYFAEGLVDWGSRLIQLTWESNVGFVYDLDSFEQIQTFSYDREGWGLTRDAGRIIMSDGSSTLRFLDPGTLRETGRLAVTERGFPVSNLNELEMVRGEIFANVWQTNEVVVIAPDTGYVTARIDFRALHARLDPTSRIDVFNGIAWDEAGDRLFVTGKWWPQLFEVRVARD